MASKSGFGSWVINMPNFITLVVVIAMVSVLSEGILHNTHNRMTSISIQPDTLSMILNEQETVTYIFTNKTFPFNFTVSLNASVGLVVRPTVLRFAPDHLANHVNITGVDATSRAYVDIQDCVVDADHKPCSFRLSDIFLTVSVSHSRFISVLIHVTGWIYFFAWSISFYPQIVLNFQRRSVEGLNFDFLVLNLIGFFCYSVYNCLMFWDSEVQDLYINKNPRAQIPVLLNDVVFSLHALFACVITGFQCFIYERGQQRVSYICISWSFVLLLFSGGSLTATLVGRLDWLRFITFLSYVKMGVTLSKYFPQLVLNFRRKSTVGWSIGNVLLDFTGGVMDIVQMLLQSANTDDWSAFYGNPVKFGLGLVSMVFDVAFILQHYVLYRHTENYEANNDPNESLETVVYDNENPNGNDTTE